MTLEEAIEKANQQRKARAKYADGLDQLRAKANGGSRANMRLDDEEHRIQAHCVKWFRREYPEMAMSLIAVPNGGARAKATGGKLKAEGVLAGVSDLILLEPSGELCGLMIEMKTPDRNSRQKESQQIWESHITRNGRYDYVICRSLEEFQGAVSNYLGE